MQKMYSKPFKTLDEQINLLKERKVIIENDEFVKKILLEKNYFDLINGFESLMLKNNEGLAKEFYENTNLKDFIYLYEFDKQLATIIFKYIDEFENRLKTSVAYRFAEDVSNAGPKPNPASYIDILMYNNPYSVSNRLKALPAGTITQHFVDEINVDIDRYINAEIARIDTKINRLNTIPLDYISKKSRSRITRVMNKINIAINNTNIAINNTNLMISATPSVMSSTAGVRNSIFMLRLFTETLTVNVNKVSSTIVDPNQVEQNIREYINEIEELIIRTNKIYSRIALNDNTAINNVPKKEIQGFMGHDLFKTNYGKNNNENYIENAKLMYGYLRTYEIPPYWVIIKTLELGKLQKLLYGLKNDVLDKVLLDMGLKVSERHILFNSTKIIVDLRNHCAHFGLVNRFRTKENTKIHTELINKLDLKTKSDGATFYEIRLYDTLKVLGQFTKLDSISEVFRERFILNKFNKTVIKKLLSRMGNEDLIDWISLDD